MHPFRATYDKLPDAAKDRIMGLLEKAIHHRGHDNGVKPMEPGYNATIAVSAINSVLEENNVHMLEYN